MSARNVTVPHQRSLTCRFYVYYWKDRCFAQKGGFQDNEALSRGVTFLYLPFVSLREISRLIGKSHELIESNEFIEHIPQRGESWVIEIIEKVSQGSQRWRYISLEEGLILHFAKIGKGP